MPSSKSLPNAYPLFRGTCSAGLVTGEHPASWEASPFASSSLVYACPLAPDTRRRAPRASRITACLRFSSMWVNADGSSLLLVLNRRTRRPDEPDQCPLAGPLAVTSVRLLPFIAMPRSLFSMTRLLPSCSFFLPSCLRPMMVQRYRRGRPAHTIRRSPAARIARRSLTTASMAPLLRCSANEAERIGDVITVVCRPSDLRCARALIRGRYCERSSVRRRRSERRTHVPPFTRRCRSRSRAGEGG